MTVEAKWAGVRRRHHADSIYSHSQVVLKNAKCSFDIPRRLERKLKCVLFITWLLRDIYIFSVDEYFCKQKWRHLHTICIHEHWKDPLHAFMWYSMRFHACDFKISRWGENKIVIHRLSLGKTYWYFRLQVHCKHTIHETTLPKTNEFEWSK